MKNKSHFAVLIVTAVALFLSINVTRSAINPGKDWPTWRGPAQNGIAAPGQNPPVEWKYGSRDGEYFIEFYKGNSMEFFWALSTFVHESKITSLQINGK